MAGPTMKRVEAGEGAAGWSFGPAALRWTGPCDVDPRAPWVAWSLALEGDGAAFGRAVADGDARGVAPMVARLPMPWGMLLDLARRCVEWTPDAARAQAAGRESVDPRWTAALTTVLAEAGAAVEDAPASDEAEPLTQASPGREPTHLLRRADGTLAVLTQRDRLAAPPADGAELILRRPDGRETRLPFPHERGRHLALLRPADGDDDLVLTAWSRADQRVDVWMIDPSGAVRGPVQAAIGTSPLAFTRHGDRLWLHGEEQDVEVEIATGGVGRTLATYHSNPARLSWGRLGDWLPRPGARHLAQTGWCPKTIHWISLDDPTADRVVPWRRPVAGAALDPAGGALWLASEDGLWRLSPDGEPTRVVEVDAWGLALVGDALHVGARLAPTAFAVLTLDARTGRELDRRPVAHFPFRVDGVPGGVVARGLRRWTWLPDGGDPLTSEDRANAALARLADGTCAVAAGREVLVIGPDGALRRHLRLPFDGRLWGATDTCFVYGPGDHEPAPPEHDAFLALDADGAVVARLPRCAEARDEGCWCLPRRTLYATGQTKETGIVAPDGVYLTRGRTGRVGRWRPGSDPRAATAHGAPPPRGETRVEEVVKGYHTINPRDDWVVHGLEVPGGPLLALDGRYAGTTGVAPGRAVRAVDAAVVTLFRCHLGADGVEARRASTVILLDCTGPGAKGVAVDETSFVVRVE